MILKKGAREKETERKLQKLKSESVNVSNVTIHSIDPIFFSIFDGVDSKRFSIRQNEALPYLIFKF